MKKLAIQYPVISFFLLTLAWSSIVWLIILPSFHISATSGSDWFWIGECAPGLTAIFLTWLTQNGKAVLQLMKPIIYWRASPFYYYLVIILVAFFYLAAIGATGLEGHTIPTLATLYPKEYFGFLGMKFYGLAMIPVFTLLYYFCEELGWRGYALPKLMQHVNAFTAAIIIGVVWSLFHLPLMKFSILITHPLSFFYYMLSTIMSSLFLTWLYLKTNGSLLLVSLSHGLTDMYGAFSPTIISSLGQGESTTVIFLRFLFFLPIFILLFKERKKSTLIR